MMITQQQAYDLGRLEQAVYGGDIPPPKPADFHSTEAHRLAYLDGFQGFAFHTRRADGMIPRREKTLLP